jgi:molybdate/tungstate transport system permease protein
VTQPTSSATFPALSGQSRTALFSFASGIALMFLAGPLVKLVATSDLRSLLSAFVDPEVLSAIGVSVVAATWATVAAALAGVPLGFLLARRDFRGRRWSRDWSTCRW